MNWVTWGEQTEANGARARAGDTKAGQTAPGSAETGFCVHGWGCGDPRGGLAVRPNRGLRALTSVIIEPRNGLGWKVPLKTFSLTPLP